MSIETAWCAFSNPGHASSTSMPRANWLSCDNSSISATKSVMTAIIVLLAIFLHADPTVASHFGIHKLAPPTFAMSIKATRLEIVHLLHTTAWAFFRAIKFPTWKSRIILKIRGTSATEAVHRYHWIYAITVGFARYRNKWLHRQPLSPKAILWLQPSYWRQWQKCWRQGRSACAGATCRTPSQQAHETHTRNAERGTCNNQRAPATMHSCDVLVFRVGNRGHPVSARLVLTSFV